MPLRDHFRGPLASRRRWTSLHSQWPAMIVLALNRFLPERYVAEPRVYIGSSIEVDVGTIESPRVDLAATGASEAASAWAPPRANLSVETAPPDADEYAVHIYDVDFDKRLVAALEIVSPSNKDRPDSRQAFVSKCETLLHEDVCVAIVDLVTERHFNLYGDLLERLGASPGPGAPVGAESLLYAAACRYIRRSDAWNLEAWSYALEPGQPLPTLPIWLDVDLAVPLDLETTYEDACRALRIA